MKNKRLIAVCLAVVVQLALIFGFIAHTSLFNRNFEESTAVYKIPVDSACWLGDQAYFSESGEFRGVGRYCELTTDENGVTIPVFTDKKPDGDNYVENPFRRAGQFFEWNLYLFYESDCPPFYGEDIMQVPFESEDFWLRQGEPYEGYAEIKVYKGKMEVIGACINGLELGEFVERQAKYYSDLQY